VSLPGLRFPPEALARRERDVAHLDGYGEGYADGLREAVRRATTPAARRDLASIARSTSPSQPNLLAVRIAHRLRSLILKGLPS
jgi:hypothetical protein